MFGWRLWLLKIGTVESKIDLVILVDVCQLDHGSTAEVYLDSIMGHAALAAQLGCCFINECSSCSARVARCINRQRDEWLKQPVDAAQNSDHEHESKRAGKGGATRCALIGPPMVRSCCGSECNDTDYFGKSYTGTGPGPAHSYFFGTMKRIHPHDINYIMRASNFNVWGPRISLSTLRVGAERRGRIRLASGRGGEVSLPKPLVSSVWHRGRGGGTPSRGALPHPEIVRLRGRGPPPGTGSQPPSRHQGTPSPDIPRSADQENFIFARR